MNISRSGNYVSSRPAGSRLPVELWTRIFEVFLALEPIRGFWTNRWRQKEVLLYVSHSWHDIAEPVLLGHVILTWPKIPLFLERIRARPSLACCVKILQIAGQKYNDSELFPPEPIASLLPRLPNLRTLKKLANIYLGDDAVLEALSTAPHFQRLELYLDLTTSHLRICRLQGLLNLTLKVDTYKMGYVKGADLQARLSALPGISHANLRKLTLKTRLGLPPKRGFFIFLSKCSFPALESLALDFKASQMAEPESLQLLTSFFGAHRRLTELSFVNVRAHQLAYALPPEACHSVEVVSIGYLVEKADGDRTFRLHPDSSVRKLVLLHGLHEQHRREYSSFLGGMCSHLPAVLDSAGHSHPRQVVFSELEWQGVYCDCDCGWCPPEGIFETCLKLGRELSAKGIALVDKHGRLVVQASPPEDIPLTESSRAAL